MTYTHIAAEIPLMPDNKSLGRRLTAARPIVRLHHHLFVVMKKDKWNAALSSENQRIIEELNNV